MKRRICSARGLVLLLACLAPAVTASSADWPQWRGPDRTDVSGETGLLKKWPEGGPKRVWLFDKAGLGYAGPSIASGKLFTMGIRNGAEELIAVDAGTGKELWAVKMGEVLKNSWGDGPRGTPTVDGDRVYALGGRGDLVCANVTDGKILWRRTMKEFGGKTPGWGYTESVLVDGDKVVCTPGGEKGAVVALDRKTGEPVWQSKDFTDGAQYASIITVDHNGARQYIQLTMKHVVGLAARDGSVLWTADWPGETAVIPTPIFHDGHVYVTAGYAVGCKLIKVGANNQASEVYFSKLMQNHHGGVLLKDGHIYGHSDQSGWTCQNFKTGEKVWAEKGALGKGAVTCADGMLYCLAEKDGTVVLAEASPKGWQEHGRFKLEAQSSLRSNRGKIWTHPVVAGGRLYLRDQELLSCYDVKAK
jgi:outer membrane protein assembly factor BamB